MDVDTGPDIPNGREKIIVDHCKLVYQALLAFAKNFSSHNTEE